MGEIACWYEFASTYSYLAIERVQAATTAAGVGLSLRPFLLGPIFADQGWRDSPFNLYPAKGRYMWRDMARRCQDRGLAFRRPETFPKNGLRAARVAFLGQDAAWGYPFSVAVYRASFRDDADISDPALLSQLLSDCGVDGPATLARAGEPDVKHGLRAQTEQAVELGIFGAPTFVVGQELFWGDDRLEDAIAWTKQAHR